MAAAGARRWIDRFILEASNACLVDEVNIGDGVSEYVYDALGRRIEKRSGGVATRYLHDGARVAEEWDVPAAGSPALAASYVYGNYIDEVLTMRRGGVDYYYHADDQHNVVKLTDNAGAVVEAYDYADYGLPEFFDAAGARLEVTASQFANPYLFTGRQWDAELGYSYYRNRYLDPAHGRFASRDPLGLWGDPLNLGNGYTYAASNPWSLVDPMGLEACEEGGNGSGVTTGSSIVDFLKFFWYVGPKDKLSSDGVDWNRFNGAGSEYLRENDHESRVLRAHKENAELTQDLARQGVNLAVAEGIGRAVVAGTGLVVTGVIKGTGEALGQLAVNEIRFSQRTVNPQVRDYARKMMAGEWDFARSPIHVMEREGRWVSYDNRRLMAARLAGLDHIPVQIVNPSGPSVRPRLTWEQAFTRRFNDRRNVNIAGPVPNNGIWELPKIVE